MISKQELIIKHTLYNLPVQTVEKDYVLGLMLWGIYNHPILSRTWVFKGGTCIKKCFIPQYRFSEDLDFTLTKQADIAPTVIAQQLAETFESMRHAFGINIDRNNVLVDPFLDKQGACLQVKIPFQGPLGSGGSLPKIKLDLSQEEVLVDQPVQRKLFHDYSDREILELTHVACYSREEIFAEKLRALAERTRPRDLYDVVNLHKNFSDELDTKKLWQVAEAKFSHKKLSFPQSVLHIPESHFATAKADWHAMLAHQIPNLAPIEDFIKSLQDVHHWLQAEQRQRKSFGQQYTF